MKSVALIAFLSHIGCFVPADKAVVGIVDRMFSRIQSRDSASTDHSSFTLDLAQMGAMLHHATPHSLLLIDEFGKGTDPIGAPV